MAGSNPATLHASIEAPEQADLDKCVHCGLCLNACPTYRELGLESDSPRGRIYQMVQVAQGAPITTEYVKHMELCLACRGCETACPSGVPYGRLIEAARTQIESNRRRPLLTRLVRAFVFGRLLPSYRLQKIVGAMLALYQKSGLQKLVRASGVLKVSKSLANLEALTPRAETPFFYSKIGNVYPAIGKQRSRVILLAGCIANIAFARLNEATVRVLQKNGCEVVVAPGQNCCGALHVHSGIFDTAQELARRNIDACLRTPCDAIITNTAGCGSTLKEYDHLLRNDAEYAEKARHFSSLVKDVNEFLAAIELNPDLGRVEAVVTYQDSCHLAHGQKITKGPRKLLQAIPGLTFRDMPGADLCCGSAGIYNVVQNEMSMQVLERKMLSVEIVKPEIIATANPGCMLQLEAGVRLHGKGERVLHVIQLLDESYARASQQLQKGSGSNK